MILVRTVLRQPEAATGLVLLAVLALLALLAPVLFPGDPLKIAGRALTVPFTDPAFPLGTDRLGRDVLAGIVHGARTSLFVGLAAALAALAIGLSVGLAAGFAGGIADEALMRVVDAFQIVPSFLLALAFVSVVGPSVPVVVLAIALGAWADPARLTRAEVLSARERDYVAAARVAGMHPVEIALREILPIVLPPVLALSAIIVAAAILTEAALSFLGLGDPNVVTWGSMIAEGRNVLRSAPFLSIFPGLALVATVIGVYLFSEGLTNALAGEGRANVNEGKKRRSRGKSSSLPGRAERDDSAGDNPPAEQGEEGVLCRVKNLSVTYRGQETPALRDLDLPIRVGERLAIIGESGSGKSTFARALAGLLPDGAEMEGRVHWTGSAAPRAGRDLGYVLQDPSASLNPVLTIGEQVAEGARRHLGLSWPEACARALDMLERVHLPEPKKLLDAYPHQLSGGQRQRVAIAAALAARPGLLIADEPTSALDMVVQAEIVALLDELVRAAGMTLVFITHDIALAAGFADRVAIFKDGALVETGPAAAVLAAPHATYTKQLVASHRDLASTPLVGEIGA
ncbi:ABC-type dipeptide/oligopeptide/nickel transport system ATPase component [Shinella sp. DD12]|jgi:ABC-type dipeptide/oligopeptide/nickel transport system permease subunit/ABC-type dipeptide/oligopeptide/nickel transport system ATPase component|nr:ABC-type dipeptide/oligopeptide/nickel transport system ATPase component [Shinella sp. DD12]